MKENGKMDQKRKMKMQKQEGMGVKENNGQEE
jgi:hypothetical protein